ncbi:major facilitator superfamily domain-containing protein [Mycena rosella]|uniref:Major facilitator superfamily domain-containing protein n=1 Tax=Mycena rosella TaxID=1033263 RepID=A0AAD7GFM1_MYCRO|nr:major facilitator superfamily domain-containing protein [Mycena rosella]
MSTTTPPLEGDAPASDLPSRAVSPLHDALDIDIEHMPIADDPRAWSPFRKNVVLTLIASASMIAGLAANIQNPAITDMEADLPASASQISLYMPLFWSAISEVKGRKLVYVMSIAIFTAGSVVVVLSKTIELVIVFRCIQATGSSAVMAIGAATLTDIFDPIECGTKLGFYYMAPLLGPSLAPIMGGVLTQGFSWRAPFWFLVVVSGLSCLSILVFLKDMFRQERSMTYQSVLKSRLKARSASATTSCTASIAEKEPVGVVENLKATDLEKQDAAPDVAAALPVIKLTMRDVNPFKPLRQVLRRTNNLVILLPPVRLMFAFNFVVVYSASRTLESAYGYNALKVGLVLLSQPRGSIFSGRWSDKTLAWLKAANGRVSDPEMRLKSTALGLCLLPPSVLVFGWVSEKRMHVATMFFAIWAYTLTLAYIVDANNGPSSTVVATNSAFRGISAFVCSVEVAVPLQDSVGDGWQYTICAGLLVLVGLLVLLVVRKGGVWREASEACEKKAEERV